MEEVEFSNGLVITCKGASASGKTLAADAAVDEIARKIGEKVVRREAK